MVALQLQLEYLKTIQTPIDGCKAPNYALGETVPCSVAFSRTALLVAPEKIVALSVKAYLLLLSSVEKAYFCLASVPKAFCIN